MTSSLPNEWSDQTRPHGRRMVFLDRDGTLNVDTGYVYRWEDWRFIEGALEGLRMLRDAGFELAVVTNQSGIGRGRYDEQALRRLHEHVDRVLRDEGIVISAYAFCPHVPEDDCPCRKPRTGMLDQIWRPGDAPIEFAASWTVGDKPADIGFGQGLGTRTVLLRSSYWRPTDVRFPPDAVADNLREAAAMILRKAEQADGDRGDPASP